MADEKEKWADSLISRLFSPFSGLDLKISVNIILDKIAQSDIVVNGEACARVGAYVSFPGHNLLPEDVSVNFRRKEVVANRKESSGVDVVRGK